MNLPKTARYKVIATHHMGGLENASCCDNCGRPIVEVAELSDEQDNRFNVGMDCAQTLTVDYFQMEAAKAYFQERKTFLAKLRKARKTLPDAPIKILRYGPNSGFYKQGGFTVSLATISEGGFWKNYPTELDSIITPLCK